LSIVTVPERRARKHAVLVSRLTPEKVHGFRAVVKIPHLTGLKFAAFATIPGDVAARLWRRTRRNP